MRWSLKIGRARQASGNRNAYYGGGGHTASTIGLTALGQQKADQFEGTGIRGHVLSVLSESGPCTLSEIREHLETRGVPCDYPKLKAVIKWLIAAGYARPIGSDGIARPNLKEV